MNFKSSWLLDSGDLDTLEASPTIEDFMVAPQCLSRQQNREMLINVHNNAVLKDPVNNNLLEYFVRNEPDRALYSENDIFLVPGIKTDYFLLNLESNFRYLASFVEDPDNSVAVDPNAVFERDEFLTSYEKSYESFEMLIPGSAVVGMMSKRKENELIKPNSNHKKGKH